MVLRGGTSKGAYFVGEDLPADSEQRDSLLLRIMGSPDERQIDGIGGAHPLTSKVAIVSVSDDDAADIDYLFLQIGVGQPTVSDRQNCGNLLAGVAPFAIERGLVESPGDDVSLRIRMLNTNAIATASMTLVDGQPTYEGGVAISGVPGTAAPIYLDFEDTAGSTCGSLLPTGNVVDVVAGIEVSCVDNGMPTVVLRAADLGIEGDEECRVLEDNELFRERLEGLRLAAAELMGLGDVREATIPKMTLLSRPRAGGSICTRTFIPHRCHDAIGVLGAVSVATAILLRGAPGSELFEAGEDPSVVDIEHPTGTFTARIEVTMDDDKIVVGRSGIVRTARKLMDGMVFPRSPRPQEQGRS